ncbi:LAFE_0D08592g1_1 [Lachancea fermentati]|uniref:Exocyst complex component Sec8 n=1 Tax=Lachancea fermentati TaxID=4955 RepID=A0A1G4MC53_LACFM|nr:LAFE_0D08592g1_1 [Lachancea fermentati]
MNLLRPPVQRKRALSVNNATDSEKKAMNNALDNLQNDLGLIESQWSRIITKKTNPLELALNFLDDTSVGLGHRYGEFNHLKSQLAGDLQQAVNEHYQAFNTNIASYEQTLEYISESQRNIGTVRDTVDDSLSRITNPKGSLGELNENSNQYTKMIEILGAIERLLRAPDVIEDHIRNKRYAEAKDALMRCFSLANSHNLWNLKVLQTTKQILDSQEHTLFETLMEDINDIIYSKRTNVSTQKELFQISVSDTSFNSLENYLSSVVNIDILEQSHEINKALNLFLNKLGRSFADPSTCNNLTIESESEYDRLFTLLSTLNDMNRLHAGLSIIVQRSKEETRSIVSKSVDEMRLKHPSLMKMAMTLGDESDFGISGRDVLSVVLRNLFWGIFTKLLLAIQAHRAIYEISKVLQSSGTNNDFYRFDEVWGKVLDEVKVLVNNYTKNSLLYKDNLHRGSAVIPTENGNNSASQKSLLFSLQSNIENDSATKDHANVLKEMLKEMFPGFSMATSMELKNIYLEEEAFEQEDTVIPPKVFNMMFILESFLLFVQGSSGILPLNFHETIQPPFSFFTEYMRKNFLPHLEKTLMYFFDSKIQSNNPYTLETMGDGRVIFKAAYDFRTLFAKALYVMNASHNYRKSIVDVLLKLLNRFFEFYYNIFSGLLGSSHNRFNKKLITVWLENTTLVELTEKVFQGHKECVSEENFEMFKSIPEFYQRGKCIDKQDFFNNVTLDTLAFFLSTITWVNEWLPQLKKVVAESVYGDADTDADKLRGSWSFFEAADFENIERFNNLKISLCGESINKFDKIAKGFEKIEHKLLACLRYDLRVRSIYYITEFIHTSSWNPTVASVELDQNISTLTTELGTMENRFRELISGRQKDFLFAGLTIVHNYIFIEASRSILILNHNGIKKMIRNINVLQHACRNIANEPSDVDMSRALTFFYLCSTNEMTIINKAHAGELDDYSHEDIKNMLRLHLSEELQRQMKRQSGTHRVPSISANKRLTDAMKRLDEVPHK